MKFNLQNFFLKGGIITGIGLFCSFITTIISQQSLSAELFGRYAFIVLLINTSVLIVRGVFLQQISPLSFYISEKNDDMKLSKYFGFLIIAPFILGLCLAFSLFFTLSFANLIDLSILNILIFSISTGFLCSIGCLSGILRYKGHIVRPLTFTLVLPEFALIVGVLASLSQVNFFWFFSIFQLLVITLIIFLSLYFVSKRTRINFKISLQEFKQFLNKGTRGGSSILVGVLLRNLDSLLLGLFLTNVNFGIYSYARKFAELTSLAGPLINARIINQLSYHKTKAENLLAFMLLKKMSLAFVLSILFLLTLLNIIYFSLHTSLDFLKPLNLLIVVCLVILRTPQSAASIFPQGFIAFGQESVLFRINFYSLFVFIVFFLSLIFFLDPMNSAFVSIFLVGGFQLFSFLKYFGK